MTSNSALSPTANDRNSGPRWIACCRAHDNAQPGQAISMDGDGCITMAYSGGE